MKKLGIVSVLFTTVPSLPVLASLPATNDQSLNQPMASAKELAAIQILMNRGIVRLGEDGQLVIAPKTAEDVLRFRLTPERIDIKGLEIELAGPAPTPGTM